MAAKKKSISNSDGNSDGNRGINKDGKVVGFTPIKAKPTEAFTNPGQAAKGLAKPSSNNRFSMDDAGKKSGVASQKAFDVLQRAAKEVTIAAASYGAGGLVGRAAAAGIGRLGLRYGGAAADSAFETAAKGLEGMSSGGKIKNVVTPLGKTIAISKLMTEGQVAAARSGLEQRAINIAIDAGSGAVSKAAQDATKVAGVVKKAVTGAGIIGGAAATSKKKLPKKK